MEDLNSTLLLLWDVLREIQAGSSVRSGVQRHLLRCNGQHQYQLETWLRGRLPEDEFRNMSSVRRELFVLVKAGIQGESIEAGLRRLETEVILSCESEISHFAAILPLRTLGPLLFFVFPSMLSLLLVPLLNLLAA